MTPRFRVRDDGRVLVVVDPIMRRRYPLGTDRGTDPERTDTGVFPFPVSSAVEFETGVVRLPTVVSVFVRRADGRVIARCEHDANASLPAGEYFVDVNAPVKLYLHAESELTVRASEDGMVVDFGRPTTVRLGARSYHDRPEATVTTTREPEDLMAGVSTFGSALKTTSPERSFPTLRGHPPLFEFGEALSVPDGLDRPDTGVTLELPPDLEHLLPAASLAFYLGAAVVPGDRPRLVTDEGFVHDLAADRGYRAEVERVLKQVFLLECAARTEGLYPVDLYERAELDRRLDVDFAELYAMSLAERVAASLAVPFAELSDVVPQWRLAVDCPPEPAVAALLPFVANDLGVVRPVEEDAVQPAPELQARVEEFARGGDGPGRDRRETAPDGGPEPRVPAEPYVEVRSEDALETVWAGSGRPMQGGKLLREGFVHKFDRDRPEGDIDIAVVCNDPSMAAEYEDEQLYGDRATVPYTVTEFRELTVEGLREVLASRRDFLHYIGHVEENAFECRDGSLSADEVAEMGASAFLLNGCESYWQGVQLVERGGVAGIVTNSDVGNVGAVRVGQHIARLLNRGFSVQSALNIVRREEIAGSAYVAVGATNHAVVQSDSGTPMYWRVADDGDGYSVTIETYPTTGIGFGAVIMPFLSDSQQYYLASGPLPEFTGLSADDLVNPPEPDSVPVDYDDEFQWLEHLDL